MAVIDSKAPELQGALHHSCIFACGSKASGSDKAAFDPREARRAKAML